MEVLLNKARKGDVSSFEELIKEHTKLVYNYCYRMTNSLEDAEDLAQEVFIKAFRSIKKFKGNSKFSTWIYSIAVRVCIDFNRKNKTVISIDKTQIPLTDDTMDPEAIIMDEDEKNLLYECLDTLTPHYKSAIILRDIQEKSYDEISKILNLPLNTVRTHIRRGRNQLKQVYLDKRR